MDSAAQKQLYEAIHDEYEHHYYDNDSMAYRERFYYEPLFDGVDLNDKSVADLASGSGHNSKALLRRFPSAKVTGYDISNPACAAYRRNVARPAIETDLTRRMSPTESYDAAMVVGGLHHCVADLSTTLSNIAGMVKPGGMLLMIEPNRECYLEGMRRLWYRLDKRYFDTDTEAALSHGELLDRARPNFDLRKLSYMGGPAYFLIAQSLLFRMPKRVKSVLRSPLMEFEKLYNRLPSGYLFPYFVAQWRRVDPSADLAR